MQVAERGRAGDQLRGRIAAACCDLLPLEGTLRKTYLAFAALAGITLSVGFQGSAEPAASISAASTTASAPKSDYGAFTKKLSKNEQAVHAVERLTFGPTAEDLDAVHDEPVEGLIADDTRSLFNARIDPRSKVVSGGRLSLAVAAGQFHFFDPVTGVSLRSREALHAAT